MHGTKLSLAGGLKSNVSMVCLGSKSLGKFKGKFRTRAALVSGEGDLLSYSSNNGMLGQTALNKDQSHGVEMQADVVALGALSADTAPTSVGFAIDNDECDLDRPTPGFASIAEAIEDVRQGKVGRVMCVYI